MPDGLRVPCFVSHVCAALSPGQSPSPRPPAVRGQAMPAHHARCMWEGGCARRPVGAMLCFSRLHRPLPWAEPWVPEDLTGRCSWTQRHNIVLTRVPGSAALWPPQL